MKHVAVILAAGSGTRLGGVAKALLPLGAHSYLETIVQTVTSVGGEALVVVGGPFADEVAARATVPTVVNPDASRGMASSIATGFASLDTTVDAAWIWPVDHPHVRRSTLDRILGAFQGDHSVVRPTYNGRGGHPPLVGRGRFAALAACARAPGGARDVLRTEDTIDLPVDDPGVVRDVDHPEDLTA